MSYLDCSHITRSPNSMSKIEMTLGNLIDKGSSHNTKVLAILPSRSPTPLFPKKLLLSMRERSFKKSLDENREELSSTLWTGRPNQFLGFYDV